MCTVGLAEHRFGEPGAVPRSASASPLARVARSCKSALKVAVRELYDIISPCEFPLTRAAMSQVETGTFQNSQQERSV